ncbi:MAG: DUF5050 domain-containing protein, partial [Oscillospiraceae bacterium]|nr:DUF5050 domain-containing protein [Oscillospiraceae bacterium]
MKTKILSAALATVMLLTLVACGNGGNNSGGNSGSGSGRDGNTSGLGTSGDKSSGGDTWPPPGGELIYAQVGVAFSGTSDGANYFEVSKIDFVTGVLLFFDGEAKENFRRPEISDFVFYINGVPQELNEYMSFDYGNVWETDKSWKAGNHFDNVPGDEGMMTVYSYSVESKSDGLFDKPLAEYYFEMTVNGVPIRSNTFYWGEGVNYEFKDDMPSFPAPVHLVPKRQILPLTPVTIAEHERGNINGNRFVALGGDLIYYVARYELFKMRLDGTDVEKIILDFPATAINVVGDYIYIHSRHNLSTDEGYTEVDRIYRLKSDESELTILFERPTDYGEGGSIGSFLIVGEWLYYITTAHYDDGGDFGSRSITNLNRVRADDGTGDMQVTDIDSYRLNIDSDWNYHIQIEWIPVPGSDHLLTSKYEIIRTRNDGSATE